MMDLKELFYSLTTSSEGLNDLLALFKPKVLKKGDYFIQEGQVAKELAFLDTGIIRVFYRNNKGIEYNKHFFIPPCLIGGYSSLITEKPSQVNQQALTDCTIYVITYSEIQKLYYTFPNIERMARVLAEKYFVQKEKREIELVLLDAEERYHIFRKQFPQLEQQIPQYHVASYLGITPTQLSRIRKKLSRK